MSDHQDSPLESTWIIWPDTLQLEVDAQNGSRQIAHGRWRNIHVVVKVLCEQTEASALHARGELWTSLQHANVLRTFGVSSFHADPLYVVIQSADGNVTRFLERNPQADRTKIVHDVALGMQYLHGRGVVHGSLKPTNILIGADGSACIADYGMIEVQTSVSNGHRYFSPEAWKGTISRSSDVFAWAMCALEIFTSKAPWGILSEQQIFHLVVKQDTRPDRPDEDFGLTDYIWGILEKCWERDSRRRPTSDTLAQLLGNNVRISAKMGVEQAVQDDVINGPQFPSRSFSMMTQISVPPAYEISTNANPGSAPPTVSKFTVTNLAPADRIPALHPPRPQYTYVCTDTASVLSGTSDRLSEDGITERRRRLMPSAYDKHRALCVGSGPSQSSESIATYTSFKTSSPSLVSGSTALNATLLAGALLSEVKEGRDPDVIDPLLSKIQTLGLRSHKDAQKLVTAGAIPTLTLLLKTRAIGGIGLEIVLLALGILTHDSITANTMYRTGTSATLIEIVDAAHSENVAALAVWCLARICRNADIATGLLKQNLGRLLVVKGLRAGSWLTARMAAWCLGALIRSDAIADMFAEMGLVSTLCEHMWRCSQSVNASAEDYSAAIYAVARMARSVKIAKALAKGGCVEMLAHCLNTAEDARLLLWSARGIGCMMRPNSSDMAKVLLDAGVARGLARLPSVLSTEEVEPLGAFAFAIQRFSCAEWGGGTRKALVDAGVVDSLLAALRTAADEPYPEIHIELALAIALLSDVGGASIRKEIVNAGGIMILKRVGSMAARSDVAKACNLAATSITGNVWSRNAASAKAALAHEWSGGCPEFLPGCPVPLTDI